MTFLPPVACWKCGKSNPYQGVYCNVCGVILDREKRDKLEAERLKQETKRDKEAVKMKAEMEAMNKKMGEYDKTMCMVSEILKEKYPEKYQAELEKQKKEKD